MTTVGILDSAQSQLIPIQNSSSISQLSVATYSKLTVHPGVKMPSTVLGRPLYCGTCINDLVRISEDIHLDKKKPKNVCQSLSKLLDQGKKYKLDGDDEMAYIVLMRWVYCIGWLQKTPEYSRNKDLLKPYVKGSQVKDILNQLEHIADKLKKRYNAKALEDGARRIVDNVENMQIKPECANDDDLMNEVSDVQLNLPDTPTDDPAKKEADKLISCMDMYQEMHKLDDRMIIIDIRARDEFESSHIKSNQCINIPADHIRLGILATDLFKSLASLGVDENRRRVIRHRTREYCDLIVLLDWQTTAASLKPTNRLNTLKTILQDWDPGVVYREIVVLEGGYKEWLTRFPTLTTNPSITPPDDEGNNIVEMLEEVEYPDWNQSDEDQPFIKVKHKPVPERSLKPTIKNILIIPKGDSLDYRNLGTTKTLDSLNDTNIYTRTDIADDAFNNGTKFHIPSTKGTDVSSMNDQDIKRRVVITQPVENELAKPAIDRSSKPVGEKTYDTNSETLLSLLKQKNETLKSKVKLENRRLELESQLFGREVAEDTNTEQKAETLKQIEVLNTTIMEKMKQFLGIEQKLREYKQDKIGVSPAQIEAQVRLQLDIGLAENEARNVAIRRNVFLNERDKKLEENLEMKKKNMSTPPKKTEPDTHKTPLRQDGPSMNSSLKRSYSSPNLAQLESRKESIDRGLDTKIPQVDRTSKPLQQQQPRTDISNDTVINRQPLRRDREQRMSPVFGNMHPGITGLKNLGNSCYMNSIIQCLSNTTSLARYFIQGFYADDLNTKNKKTQGQVVEEVAQVIKALWCGHYRSISPRDLRVAIGQYKMQFESYEQQDSHEFLTFLLDWMHNELKTKAKLETDRSLSNAEKEWDKAMGGQTSIISQLFFGQLRSTISCTTCGNSSITYESFNSLTLSLPATIRCTLDDCIRRYVSGQRVSGWRCVNCKTTRDATKKFDFVKLAPIIVVHLNRFGETGGWIQKINTAVDFPLTSLDLRSYVANDSGTTTTTTNSYHQTYNLYAVSNHYGTMDGGHYTAYCKSASQNKWYKYDDPTVTEVSPNEVKSQTASAYLLFYTSVPNSPYMVM